MVLPYLIGPAISLCHVINPGLAEIKDGRRLQAAGISRVKG